MKNPPSKSITNNILSLSIGQGVSLVLNFLAFWLAARYLDVDSFGIFSYLLAIVIILSPIIDFGFAPIVFRETSKFEKNFEYLNAAFSVRLILFFIVLILFNISSVILKLTTHEILLTNILFLNIILSSKLRNFREIIDIPFKIALLSHYSMIVVVLDNLIFLIMVILLPMLHMGLSYLVISYVASNIPGFLIIIYLSYKKFSYRIKFSFVKAKWLIKESAPLMGYVILIAVFQQIDILLLKNLDSTYSTGIYAIATRMAIPFNIIPYALITTFFPIIVKNIKGHDEKNSELMRFIFKILFFVSFLLALICSFKAEGIVVAIFGIKYQKSYMPMILLFWSQIFLFYNFFAVDLFTAYNKQKFNFIYGIVIVLIDLIISIILIPKFSYNGVGIAKLISTFIGAFFFYIVGNRVNINMKFINIKILLWCILSASVLLILSYLPLIYYLLLSLILIIPLTVKIRFFNNQEVVLLFKTFNKEKWGEKLLKI